MSMLEKINEDMKCAMKEKKPDVVGTLRMVKAEVLKIQKSGTNKDITDEDIITIITRMIKQRNEASEQFRKGGREELALKEEREIEILKAYLPEGLSEEDISAIVDAVISETGAASMKEMGKVMGAVMKKIKETGKLADGNLVKNIVQSKLS